MTETITTPLWDDFHRHLRDDQMMHNLMKYLLPVVRMIVMPNLNPPVLTGDDAFDYLRRLRSALDASGLPPTVRDRVVFLMTIYLTRATTPADIKRAGQAGVKAVKAYPHNGTTNSQFGLDYDDYFNCGDVLNAMTDEGMLLLVHGEHPDEPDHLQREVRFLPILEAISEQHPQLKIVLEHVSTAAAVQKVKELPNVAATITAHHLVITFDDVLANPHNKCMPIAKTPEDRAAVLGAATSGNPKFFLGSDCAAHPLENKEGMSLDQAASGVFVGPVLGPAVVQIFENSNALDKLTDFVAGFGADWYGLPRNEGAQVTFARERWRVPAQYDGVVPFLAEHWMQWRVAAISY